MQKKKIILEKYFLRPMDNGGLSKKKIRRQNIKKKNGRHVQVKYPYRNS